MQVGQLNDYSKVFTADDLTIAPDFTPALLLHTAIFLPGQREDGTLKIRVRHTKRYFKNLRIPSHKCYMSCPSPAPARRVRLKLQMHRQVFAAPPLTGNGKKKG
jgi:hypothetical protein